MPVYRSSDHPTFTRFNHWFQLAGGDKTTRTAALIDAYLSGFSPRAQTLESRLDSLESEWHEERLPSCYWPTMLGQIYRQTLKDVGTPRSKRDEGAPTGGREACLAHLIERGARLQLEQDSVLMNASLASAARNAVDRPVERDSEAIGVLQLTALAGVDLNRRHQSQNTPLMNAILVGAPATFLQCMINLGARLEDEDFIRIKEGDQKSFRDEGGLVITALEAAATMTAEKRLAQSLEKERKSTPGGPLSL